MSQSINKPTNQLVNQPTNQSINRSINQSINQPTNQSINQSGHMRTLPSSLQLVWAAPGPVHKWKAPVQSHGEWKSMVNKN